MNLDDLVSAARKESLGPDAKVRTRMRAAIERKLREESSRSWLVGSVRGRVGRTLALATAAMLGVGTVFATEWHRVRSEAPAPVEALASQVQAQRPPRLTAPAPAAAPSVPPEPERPPVERRSAPRAVPQATPPLEAEMAILRTAREALRRKDGASALGALDDYDARFHAGTMQQEASALRVFALCDAGREAEARTLGRKFAHRWPHSPLGGKVEAACDAHHDPSP